MKIELNSEKMTVAELSDAINELSTQRARIIKKERDALEIALNIAMVAFLTSVNNNSAYTCDLSVTLQSGRHYRVPLNMKAIKNWQVVVQPKKEKEED